MSTNSPAGATLGGGRDRSISGFSRRYAILLVTIVATAALAWTEPAFLTERNLRNLLDQNAGIGIIACGMTFVIIAGGFDLSVAATFALSGVVAALVALQFGDVTGLLAGAAVGPLIGILNGLLVARLHLNAFLTTLASSIVIGGIGIAVSNGFVVTVTSPHFSLLGRGTLWGLTIPSIIFICFALISAALLHQNQFGRYVFAVGGNAEAARLSGIRVGLIQAATFAFSGFAASLAGVMAASKVSAGIPTSGAGLELQAIAAVVLGGTSILGGAGAIWRTIVGLFLLAIINNAFNIMNIEPYIRNIVTGMVIIIAVAINTMTERR